MQRKIYCTSCTNVRMVTMGTENNCIHAQRWKPSRSDFNFKATVPKSSSQRKVRRKDVSVKKRCFAMILFCSWWKKTPIKHYQRMHARKCTLSPFSFETRKKARTPSVYTVVYDLVDLPFIGILCLLCLAVRNVLRLWPLWAELCWAYFLPK